MIARYSLIPTNRDVRSDGNVMGASPELRIVLDGATSPEGVRLVMRPSNTPAYALLFEVEGQRPPNDHAVWPVSVRRRA